MAEWNGPFHFPKWNIIWHKKMSFSGQSSIRLWQLMSGMEVQWGCMTSYRTSLHLKLNYHSILPQWAPPPAPSDNLDAPSNSSSILSLSPLLGCRKTMSSLKRHVSYCSQLKIHQTHSVTPDPSSTHSPLNSQPPLSAIFHVQPPESLKFQFLINISSFCPWTYAPVPEILATFPFSFRHPHIATFSPL